ncbi:hypothetical protein BST97_00450 [Nonlabens spongiae]|uniref:LuxR family transcriptional regulator n=1 Tax=Nonlabens spongiae TaxID=331648 RepID=A0A1W6MG69_9FLAO|nr:hypothetical protein [Nonlabens spongiae]ARN76595.1 hypothetical protein BST97_00450 [Nonlabens spongiae]
MRSQLHRLIICLLIFSQGFSQELPPFENFDSTVYSAGNQNWAISQDENGNLYFANEQGLLRFNGAQWELYPMPNGSIARSVYCHDGRIYTGCYMDIGYWENNNSGSLVYTSLKPKIESLLQEDEQFWKILSIDEFILFQSLSGIYSFNLETENIELITRESNIWKLFKVEDNFYYQVLGEGLFQISNKKGALVSDSELLKSKSVVHIFNKSDKIYLLFKDGQLGILNNQEILDSVQIIPNKEFQVYSATYIETLDMIALGTIQNGLILKDLEGDHNIQINKKNGLDNNTLLSVFYAKDGNLWLGLDNGISYIDLDSSVTQFVDQEGVLGTVYASIVYDDQLYLGTNQGLFVRTQGDDAYFSLVPDISGQVWSLSVIGNTLYCHHDAGMFAISKGKVANVFNQTGVWESWVDHDSKTVYIGCYDGVYRSTDLSMTAFEKLEGFNISAKDFVVMDNQIFVSHEYKGLYQMDFDQHLNTVDNISLIDDVRIDKTSDLKRFGDVLFLTNRDGIFRYDAKSKQFSKDEKLSQEFLSGGFESGKMNVTSDDALWFFSQKELLKVTRGNIDDNLNVSSFNIDSRARDDMSGYENVSLLEQDKYLIGTTFGYITLDTKYQNTTEPSIKINQVKKFYNNGVENLDVSQAGILPHDQNNIYIEYSSDSYNPLRPVLYQYRLNQETWSKWDSKPQVTFNKLNHGDYEFEVRSMVDSQISSEPAIYTFEILRPFYLSYTAQIIYVLLLIATGYAIHLTYKWYYRRQKDREAKRHQKELEVLSLQNENELIQMRNEKLRSENEFRSKELAVATMGTIRKNELLNEVQSIAQKLPDSPPARELRKMVKKNLTSKKDWISFEEAFNNADKDFFKKIKAKHPSLTPGDLRLCVYLRLNLSSKEIAPLLHISPRSVEIKRYRLRKKMELDKETNLSDYIISM